MPLQLVLLRSGGGHLSILENCQLELLKVLNNITDSQSRLDEENDEEARTKIMESSKKTENFFKSSHFACRFEC